MSDLVNDDCNQTTSGVAWGVVKTAVSLILFYAALMKSFRIAEILATSGGLFSSKAMLITAIAFEAGVATYILLAPASKSWSAVIGTFSLLTLAALYSLATERSCDCFGGDYGAELTLPLDLAILLACGIFRPIGNGRKKCSNTFLIVSSTIVGVALSSSALYYQEIRSLETTEQFDTLLADMLIGREWPLTSAMHPNLSQLETGKWLIVVAKADCEHCQQLVQREFSNAKRHRNGERTAVFIAEGTRWSFQLDAVSMTPVEADVIGWPRKPPFFASPAIFCLIHGKVVAAADGPSAGDFLADRFKEL